MNKDYQQPTKRTIVCSKSKLSVFLAVLGIFVLLLLSTRIIPAQQFPERSTQFIPEQLPDHYIGRKDLLPYSRDSKATPCENASKGIPYNLLGNDTLVVIHIQKTGGSDFLRHLVTVKKDGRYMCKLPNDILSKVERNVNLPKGKHQIQCHRDPADPKSTQWLLSEKTKGWACGVHPTLSTYKSCVDTINTGTGSEYSQYRYMVILRHPVLRYLSEYEHVVRGAHWPAKINCNGKRVNKTDMPPCYPGFYEGKIWPDLTFTDYIACKSNWANNRQVMWLADLNKAGCFNASFDNRDEILLATAKCNLEKMAFFGLTEYQKETSFMFEKVFDVTFSVPLQQYNMTYLHTAPILQEIWRRTDLYDKIAAVNHLDMQLYEHALRLFARRAKAFGLNLDLQKVNSSVRLIRNFNIKMTAKKFSKGNFELPKQNGT